MRQSTTVRHPGGRPKVIATGGDAALVANWSEALFSSAVGRAVGRMALRCMTSNVADIKKSADAIDTNGMEFLDDLLDRDGQSTGEN